jgi:hypothetical protein
VPNGFDTVLRGRSGFDPSRSHHGNPRKLRRSRANREVRSRSRVDIRSFRWIGLRFDDVAGRCGKTRARRAVRVARSAAQVDDPVCPKKRIFVSIGQRQGCEHCGSRQGESATRTFVPNDSIRNLPPVSLSGGKTRPLPSSNSSRYRRLSCQDRPRTARTPSCLPRSASWLHSEFHSSLLVRGN